MTLDHRSLTGVSLHEPKGAAAATIGQVYVADGAASGAWTSGHAPAGSYLEHAGLTAPAGYLVADGASVSTTTYAVLFAEIAYTYGGSGANFNLPNCEGRFLRGHDNAAGVDPDAASRTDRGDGTTGDAVGTLQADALKDHTHSVTAAREASSIGGDGGGVWSANDSSRTTGSPSTGAANETRGVNIAVLICIKT